jgi:hypothetical protein
MPKRISSADTQHEPTDPAIFLTALLGYSTSREEQLCAIIMLCCDHFRFVPTLVPSFVLPRWSYLEKGLGMHLHIQPWAYDSADQFKLGVHASLLHRFPSLVAYR